MTAASCWPVWAEQQPLEVQMGKLSTILDQIDIGTVLLPEFQRGYVWNRDQVRGLMRSLYLGHPVGGLLLWETDAESVSVRGETAGAGTHLLLLDGQQRITTLYGVVRGKPPAFFEGDDSAFSGLHFHVDTETFEFYARGKMADDVHWVDVTKLFQDGPIAFLTAFAETPDKAATYLRRLNTLWQVTEKEFYEEKITGSDKTVDSVVEIFNRVNSGGTKLSKGDLALAKLCAHWPEARQAMRDQLLLWQQAGYKFSLDWILRNATAVATGRSLFTALDRISVADFQTSLRESFHHVGTFLDVVAGRLGLDHDRVLMGRYAFPVVSLLLHRSGGHFENHVHRDKVLYWYVQAALWGRFAGSTETVLQQDYDTVHREGIDGLIAALRRWRGGNLDVRSHNFEGATRGSRFYPMLYLLTRVKGARDLGSGLELRAEMLGKFASLQVHHIFPKALLYKAGYSRGQVNALANFCFLTQDTNLKIGKRAPEDYFAEAESKYPGALASQWIPQDPVLWRVDRYEDFLAARRELLAEAAQSFLTSLLRSTDGASAAESLVPLSVSPEDDEDVHTAQVRDLVEELRKLGCAEPSFDAEIADPVSGRQLAIAEALWPEGLQPGQGSPVVLELDPQSADLTRLAELGYEVFTSADALLGFVYRRNEVAAGTDAPAVELEEEPPQVGQDEGRLAERFGAEMQSLLERSRREAQSPAIHLLSMLADLGPLETARRLLRAPAVSDSFAALWERGRLDLTVEALVINPLFADLFSDQELGTARTRLEQFGYLADDALRSAEPDEQVDGLPEWTEADSELAKRVWTQLSGSARRLFAVLMDSPGEVFSGEELALIVGADSGAGGVAGQLGWPGRYCQSVGRRPAWNYFYPDDGRVRYSMSPQVAALFQRAREAN
ncbi:hypothetical protein FHX82_002580 [Amycolatopsis bartoniae]|nr:DUF262 domain-containing protein [Amycolatopsis bartoniae]MBB2935526.1 hypothetical protein [Amycolatopsis bartoniae]